MKKTLISTIILSAAMLGITYINRPDFPSKKAAWDIDAQEEAYYNIKKQGKRPFLKRIPNQSFFQQRAYPYDEIPRETYFAAMKDVQARRKLFHSSAATGRQLTWAAAGPTNIPGRLAALPVHPSDTNTIYIGNAGSCPEESDMNGDGTPSNILDLTFLVDFIFRGGPAPGACP